MDKQYNITIKATASSSLSKEELEKKLVIALHDVDTGYSKLDWVDEELKVGDYEITEAEEIEETTQFCADCGKEVRKDKGGNCELCGKILL